jgi:hypothetical protein
MFVKFYLYFLDVCNTVVVTCMVYIHNERMLLIS